MAFLGLFRKKARPVEVGAYLTDYVVRPFRHHRDHVEPWSGKGVPTERVLDELFFLEIFAVDYAVTMSLGPSPRRAVMEAFWKVLRRRVGEDEAPSFGEYRRRSSVYEERLALPSSDPASAVGAVFASFCADASGVVSEQAVTEFATAATAVVKFLRRFDVAEPG
ncbi:hypothetical protein KAR29_02335 [Aminithiophilus ramosus]|uniref:Uncharacterized protein n=2 Tax=Synergistales TaxID=649776 RepID=A0A9Q7A9A3_9BACT|nr:hypothetical protein [Aminithiophilus ramosus]QTX32791.1 hypothetical protein KAR29_02335 [Aminithiophilus ramosus]QVL36666.1 hypothetical protein KIH16_02320 [Synergistota bacterium]